MKFEVDKQEEFHRRLDAGESVIVSSADWKQIRKWHKEMMAKVPNNELNPWLSLGLLLMSIEQGQKNMSGILYEPYEDPINETPNLWGGDYRDYPWGRCSKCGRKYLDYNKTCDYCWQETMKEIKEKERLRAEEAKKPRPPDVPAFKVDHTKACK